MLYEHFMQTFHRLIRTAEDDGEGGKEDGWVEGEGFEGVVTLDRSDPTVMGDSHRLYNNYTLTVNTNVTLLFHEVVEDSFGATYRVLSSSTQTPFGFTPLDMRQYKLERWDIE